MAENAKSRKAKTPNQNGENRQDISETTAEITTEITKTTKSGSLAPAKRKARRGSRETSSSLPLFAEAEKKSVASVNGKRSLLVPVEALDLANRLATKAKLSVSQRDQIAEHAAHGDDGRAYGMRVANPT